MIGSISKIRPCGHHHYYKYAHANGKNDIKRVDANYLQDLRDISETDTDVWGPFALHGLVNVEGTYNNGIFANAKGRKWVGGVPNLIIFTFMFQHALYNEIILEKLNWESVKKITYAFAGSELNNFPNGIERINKNCDMTFAFGSSGQASPGNPITGGGWKRIARMNGNILPFNIGINDLVSAESTFAGNMGHDFNIDIDSKYSFESLENGYRMFYNNWPYGNSGLQQCPTSLSLKNLKNGNYMFCGNVHLRSFSTIDDMANLENAYGMFSGCRDLRTLYPDKNSFSLPKLKDAADMFYSGYAPTACRLDKTSIIKLYNAIPDWSQDSTGTIHNLGLGISVDFEKDPELHLYLKKMDINYVSPVALTEEVTSGKNWNLKIQYGGTYTAEEYISDEMKQLLNLEIPLPDNYIRCEYLEGSGTQYINTNYIVSPSTGIFGIAKHLNNSNDRVAGNNIMVMPRWQCGTTYYCTYCWNGTWDDSWLGKVGNGKFFESYLNYNNSQSVKVVVGDMVYEKSISPLTKTSTYPIYLFASNNTNSPVSNYHGRIYRLQITEGDEIVRDYIPCLDDTGRPCMRDIINGINYYNSGTGADFDYKLYEN